MKARRITTKKEWQRISEAVEEFSREKHIFTVYKIFALSDDYCSYGERRADNAAD